MSRLRIRMASSPKSSSARKFLNFVPVDGRQQMLILKSTLITISQALSGILFACHTSLRSHNLCCFHLLSPHLLARLLHGFFPQVDHQNRRLDLYHNTARPGSFLAPLVYTGPPRVPASLNALRSSRLVIPRLGYPHSHTTPPDDGTEAV